MDLPTLPPELRPGDGRFGPGPSRIRPEALAALTRAGPSFLGTSHRGAAGRALVARLRRGLTDLFALPEGYQVLLGNGGSSAFRDAAALCLIERRSAHAVFGEFSRRFAAVAAGAPHLADPVVVESPPATHPDLYPDPGVDLYALTQNETSTGVAMPVYRPAAEGLVAVDATSAAGAVPVHPADFDAYYFSPQAAFGSEGGLWAALLSPAARRRILAPRRHWVPPFLDLRLADEAAAEGGTCNTPALATLFLFAEQVDWILARGGLAWAARHQEEAAAVVYGWAERTDYAAPFVPDPAKRSRTVAVIDLDPSVEAAVLHRALAANGIVDVAADHLPGGNRLRVGMFPHVELADLSRLTAAIDWLVPRLPRSHP